MISTIRHLYSLTARSLVNTRSITRLKEGPGLKEFLVAGKNLPKPEKFELAPYLQEVNFSGRERKVYLETYGCQMNVNDTEIVWGILKDSQYVKADCAENADVILVVTCAIREGAEKKIWHRLKQFGALKKKRSSPLQVGVLGCMAERLKSDLIEKEQLVDVVVGPDSYKDLPRLLHLNDETNQKAINVLLSLDETYADVMPVRLNNDSVTAFISIMRGCDNMCSYCIVPFTRGRERSRPIDSIEKEVEHLVQQGVKEVTLLGQNVNSYRDTTIEGENKFSQSASGFKTVYKTKTGGARFGDLLDRVATSFPETRIRFTSPHPKDFPIDVLEVIATHPNICKCLHIPAQSGSSTVLERMRRGYTREAYLELIDNVKSILPSATLSSDFICGFCDETEEEFEETLTLMDAVKYHMCYMFAYSMREKTTAHRRFTDNVPHDVKLERLQRMIKMYRSNAEILYGQFLDTKQLVLVEGPSKRSKDFWMGRNDSNIKVIFPNLDNENIRPGEYVVVQITEFNSQILKGFPMYKSSIADFFC